VAVVVAELLLRVVEVPEVYYLALQLQLVGKIIQ
jgi:hypothetical protein